MLRANPSRARGVLNGFVTDPVTRGAAVERATGWSPAYSVLVQERPGGCLSEATALDNHFVGFSRQCSPRMFTPIGRYIKNININNV